MPESFRQDIDTHIENWNFSKNAVTLLAKIQPIRSQRARFSFTSDHQGIENFRIFQPNKRIAVTMAETKFEIFGWKTEPDAIIALPAWTQNLKIKESASHH